MHKKRTLTPILYILLFVTLTAAILTHSKLSLYYAFTGLTLWFDKMIPVLLPFMILSGVMVRMNLTEGFVALIYPLVRPLFRVKRYVCYVMLMGFLCGFPMGAKCVDDLYVRGMLSKREAEYLLAFCNNIGPVYFCGFVLPLLGRAAILPYVFGMYGIPLLYGLLLRYTRYRDLDDAPSGGIADSAHRASAHHAHTGPATPDTRILEHLDASVNAALQSILMLGGYMILFNLLNLLPHIVCGTVPRFLAPLLEITGGLQMLGQRAPLYALLALPFGGLSCIAQTYSCVSGTDLSVGSYVCHKLLLTLFTALWYGLWYLADPSGFLR